MFIPITVGQGIVETVFTPMLSGDYTADCQMIVSGVLYEAGEVAAVRRGTEIKLRGETQEDREFIVTLDGVEYSWYVKKPTTLQAVENGGFYKLVGEYTELNVGDRLLDLVEGEGNPDLFIPDFGNELLMTVDLETGKFKKVSVPGIIDAVASPKTFNDSVSFTICAVSRADTGGTVTVFDQNLNVLHTHEIATVLDRPGIMGVQGGRFYFPVSTSSQATVTRYGSTLTLNPNLNYLTVSAGDYVIQVPESGAGVFIQDETGYSVRGGLNLSNITPSSLLSAHEYNGRIAIVDRVSGMLHEGMVNSGGFTGTYIGDQGAISSVVVTSDGILVGFFDEGIKRYVDGVMVEQVSESGTSFMVQEDELIATRLHATDIVYNVTQQVTTLDNVEVKRNTQTTVSFQYEAEIGGPAELINSLGTVYVDGKAFDRYLPPSCSISFTMPGSPLYFNFRKMGIVGAKAYEWNVLTEPQLTMNPVVMLPRYEAQIRTYEYEEIVISGITEGYFEDIYTESPNLDFQVNGGEWSKTATVTAKDTVIARWYLERYGAKYDPNNEIRFVRNNALLGSWYVLKMGLDGVEVQREHEEPFRVEDTWQESDSTVEASRRVGINVCVAETDVDQHPCAFDYEGPKYVDLTGRVKHEPRTDLIDLNALTGASVWFGTIVTESEFNPTANVLTLKALTGAMQPAGRHLVGTASYAGVRTVHAEAIGTKVGANGSTGRSIVDLGYDALVSPKTYMYEHSAEARVGSANDVAHLGYVSQVKAAFKPVFQRMTVVPDAIERYAYIKRDINGKAADVVAFQSWAARSAHGQSEFEATSEVLPPHGIIDVLPLFGVHPSPLEKLWLSIEYRVEIPKLNYSRDFTTSPTVAQPPIFRTFNASASTVNYRIAEFIAQVGVATLSDRHEFSIEPVRTLPTVTRVFNVEHAAGKAAEVVYGPDRISDVAVGTSIKEIRAVVEFRDTNFRDVEVEDGLFTREQADEELELYSGGSIPEVVPVGDSFIVRTLQIEDDAECRPEDILSNNRKVYGYLGGG